LCCAVPGLSPQIPPEKGDRKNMKDVSSVVTTSRGLSLRVIEGKRTRGEIERREAMASKRGKTAVLLDEESEQGNSVWRWQKWELQDQRVLRR